MPARIPVRMIWFREPIDLPGGHAVVSVLPCTGPGVAAGRQYFVAHFVPAHQVIELEWFRNEKTEPVRRRITLAAIQQFE